MKYNIQPFVKWAGGKRQIIEQLKFNMPKTYNRYYEPFIGGGALLLDIQPQNAVINDVNKQLLNVYRQLKVNSELVISILKELDSVICDKEHYYEMRSKYNEKIVTQVLDAECAALTIWINKHCFNGLYRVNQKGMFNVPYNNKVSGSSMNEENLRNIGLYLNSNIIEIREGDFEDACSDVSAGDFVYFDSPYVPVSETANFTDYTKDGFSLDDHKRLAALFKNLSDKGVLIMLSNHNTPLVRELYKSFFIQKINVRRSINRNAHKRVGEEVIIKNY